MPRTDSAARVVAAPRERVFRALTDPDQLLVWLPPGDMTGRFEHFDARPGGSYRMVLTHPSPSVAAKSTTDSDVADARFVEIVPGDRVVQAIDFESDDPAYAGTMLMTWALTDAEGGTRVEFRADDVPSGISAEDHAAGMESSLANLAALVERSDPS